MLAFLFGLTSCFLFAICLAARIPHGFNSLPGLRIQRDTRRSWTSPCVRGQVRSSIPSWLTINIPRRNPNNLRDNGVPKMIGLLRDVGALNTIFRLQRNVQQMDLGRNFSGVVEGVPDPSDVSLVLPVDDIANDLKSDYRTISKYVQFSEQIITDELNVVRDHYSNSVVNLWSRVKSARLLPLLCIFKREIEAEGQHITNHVTFDDIPQCVRNSNCFNEASISNYYHRDFVVLQSLATVFNKLKIKYS